MVWKCWCICFSERKGHYVFGTRAQDVERLTFSIFSPVNSFLIHPEMIEFLKKKNGMNTILHRDDNIL